MSRRKKCGNRQHQDRLMRGGRSVECTACGDRFPCAGPCDHRDCEWVRSGEVSLDSAAYRGSEPAGAPVDPGNTPPAPPGSDRHEVAE